MSNKLLLNYHDAVIYASDLSILECPTAWLNDACILYQMTRLQHSFGVSKGGQQPDLLFLDPSVISYLMHQCDQNDDDFLEQVSSLYQAWDIPSKSKIFVPINDQFNQSRVAFSRPGGGSHWSLLLWTINNRSEDFGQFGSNFYHFDSSNGYNASAAICVSQKLMKVLHCNVPSAKAEISATVIECKTPQQNNGYDCGVFLLGFSQVLSSNDLNKNLFSKQEFEHALDKYASGTHFASDLRKTIANDIRTLVSNGY